MTWEIKFKDKDFLLVGDTDGAIALREDYESFLPSYAHLFPNGKIMRYQHCIGTRDDIQFIKKIDD